MRRALLVPLLLASLHSQEKLRVQGPTPATVVLGSAARVDLVVEGRGGDPRPPQVPAVPGLLCQLHGPSRQTFTSITGAGMQEQVTTQYQLVLQPQREGTFVLPAFEFFTGTRTQTVPSLQITAVKELRGAEFGYLDVRVEPLRVYVHEPVRVRVEFGVDKGLRPVLDVAQNRTRYFDFEVQASWLSGLPGAEVLTGPDPAADAVPVVLNRTLLMAEYDSDHDRQGKTYNSFVFHKAFLPTRPGRLELDAPMLRYHVQLREGRQGLFGERIGGQTQNYYVYGQPIALEVLPIPEKGRPTPYFGAVGRFTLEATLDRDSVKVGSSVKLVLRIAGSGNFEFLRPPDLSALEAHGLHLLGQTEERKPEHLTVTYDLTPLRADVREVPAIAWNYFDTTPGVEAFAAVATRPLPLRVLPLEAGEVLAPLPDAVRKAVTPGVDDIFDLPDLSGAPVPTPQLERATGWLLVLAPWLLVAAWTVLRAVLRHRAADPGRLRSRNAARSCRRALDAGAEPIAALTGYLGDRLDVLPAAVIGPDLPARLLAAGLDDEAAAAVVAAVERGVAARYGGQGGLDAAAVRALVEQLERAPLRRLPVVALWLSMALLGGRATAQAESALASYRAGDYAAAAEGFAHATERQDDRRLWFARGNCYVRLDDLPKALWAYECARLGLPRDRELLANIALVRRRLELDGTGGEAFAAALAALRDRFTAVELAWLCGAAMAVAAVGLGLLRRHAVGRWLGILAAVPATLIAVELLCLRPERPPSAIALRRIELRAEPRDGTAAVATVAPGVAVSLRSGDSGDWVRVDAQDRSGYARRQDLGRIQ